jgi:hypothetical protein
MNHHNFSFNFQVVAKLVDPLGRPGVWSLAVLVNELPMTATSEKPVVIELGLVGVTSTREIDDVAAQLQETLRSTVHAAINGIAFRIREPAQAAIIDRFQEQWTPPGIPKGMFSGPLNG